MLTAAKRASQVITHIGIGFAVAATITGSALLGGLAMLIEPIINVALLPFHEQAWAALRKRTSSARLRYAMIAAEKLSQTMLHASVAFVVMFGMTGSLASGGIAALVEPLCNVMILPLHDRLWEHLCRRWRLAPAVK